MEYIYLVHIDTLPYVCICASVMYIDPIYMNVNQRLMKGEEGSRVAECVNPISPLGFTLVGTNEQNIFQIPGPNQTTTKYFGLTICS